MYFTQGLSRRLVPSNTEPLGRDWRHRGGPPAPPPQPQDGETEGEGWPSLHTLVCARPLLAHGLIATLTADSVALWSIRPSIMIAQVVRSATTLQEDGYNRDLIWNPNGQWLAIITNKGYVHIYQLLPPPGQATTKAYELMLDETAPCGPGEERGAPLINLQFHLALEIDAGISAGTGFEDQLLLCTQTACAFLALSWHGEMQASGSTLLRDLPFASTSSRAQDDPIRHLAPCAIPSLFAWVTQSGQAYIAHRYKMPVGVQHDRIPPRRSSIIDAKRVTTHLQVAWSGLCFYNVEQDELPATVVAVQAATLLMALGLANGDVLVYQLSEDRSVLRFLYRLLQEHPSGSKAPLKTGAVVDLCWSPDGQVLAVTWARMGLGLWGKNGNLLFSTVSEASLPALQRMARKHPDSDIQSETGDAKGDNDAAADDDDDDNDDNDDNDSEAEIEPMLDDYFYAAHHVFFEEGGYNLFVQTPTCLHALPLLHSSVAHNPVGDNVRFPCLVGEDRLKCYAAFMDGVDRQNSVSMAHTNVQAWETVLLPELYLRANWPIRLVAADATGRHLAVAGERGLCMYSMITHKWKFFGNEALEAKFTVTARMVWIGPMLVAACQDVGTTTHSLRGFDRTRPLASSEGAFLEKLPAAVVSLDHLGPHLMVYTGDNVIRYFHFPPGASQLDLVLQMSLSDLILMPSLVTRIAWVVTAPPEQHTIGMVKRAPLILLYQGNLSLLREIDDGRWEHIILAANIDAFEMWVHDDQHISSALWSLSQSQVKCWTNLFGPHRRIMDLESETVVDDFMETLVMTLSSYPITVLPHAGTLLSIEQTFTESHSLQGVLWRSEAKSHLYLHGILRYCLGKDWVDQANAILYEYLHLDYIKHILEVLTHQALEDESDAGADATDHILRKVHRFLEQWPATAAEVMVKCARKIDATLWPYLFSVVGHPSELFDRCLQYEDLASAVSCLIIIQSTETPAVSGQLTMQLLKKSLDLEDLTAAADLVRFLKSIERTEETGLGLTVDTASHPGSAAALGPASAAPRSPAPTSASSTGPRRRFPSELPEIYDKEIMSPFEPSPTAAAAAAAATSALGAAPASPLPPAFGPLDALVAEHAAGLLERRDLRLLFHFCHMMQFPTLEWLRWQRHRAARIVDWAQVFRELHTRLDWPYAPTLADLVSISATSVADKKLARRSRRGTTAAPSADPHGLTVATGAPGAGARHGATRGPHAPSRGMLSHGGKVASIDLHDVSPHKVTGFIPRPAAGKRDDSHRPLMVSTQLRPSGSTASIGAAAGTGVGSSTGSIMHSTSHLGSLGASRGTGIDEAPTAADLSDVATPSHHHTTSISTANLVSDLDQHIRSVSISPRLPGTANGPAGATHGPAPTQPTALFAHNDSTDSFAQDESAFIINADTASVAQTTMTTTGAGPGGGGGAGGADAISTTVSVATGWSANRGHGSRMRWSRHPSSVGAASASAGVSAADLIDPALSPSERPFYALTSPNVATSLDHGSAALRTLSGAGRPPLPPSTADTTGPAPVAAAALAPTASGSASLSPLTTMPPLAPPLTGALLSPPPPSSLGGAVRTTSRTRLASLSPTMTVPMPLRGQYREIALLLEQYLATMRQAGCYDWALVLASMLGHVDTLRRVMEAYLSEDEPAVPETDDDGDDEAPLAAMMGKRQKQGPAAQAIAAWKATLASLPCGAYTELLEELEHR